MEKDMAGLDSVSRRLSRARALLPSTYAQRRFVFVQLVARGLSVGDGTYGTESIA
jgi:hypothetical protein